MTNISVLICTRDRPEGVAQALESVVDCDHTGLGTVDVHIMDQSTTTATRTIVEELATRHADQARIVYHHLEKAGLSRAYNLGVQACAGDIIACTDDDVIVHRHWLTTIARAFCEDPELGLLYGQVLVPAELANVPSDEIVIPSLSRTTRQRLHRRDRNFVLWGMGADMAMRRIAHESVGGFDEALGGGAPLRSSQDFDFSLRVYRAGHAVLLEPDVKVDHYGTRTAQQWPETLRNYGIGDGAFYSKHVRCGDLRALRLLLRRFAHVTVGALVSSARQRRPVGLSPYGRSLFTGIRLGSRFDVDRDRRLYRETRRARIHVTDANAVTTAARGHG
jgi:glycosyltransferase involved in cell wall biosynthesis